MEGDLLDDVNLKGILVDLPICDNTSSIDTASSIRYVAVSQESPSQGARVGKVSFCVSLPTLIAFLFLPIS